MRFFVGAAWFAAAAYAINLRKEQDDSDFAELEELENQLSSLNDMEVDEDPIDDEKYGDEDEQDQDEFDEYEEEVYPGGEIDLAQKVDVPSKGINATAAKGEGLNDNKNSTNTNPDGKEKLKKNSIVGEKRDFEAIESWDWFNDVHVDGLLLEGSYEIVTDALGVTQLQVDIETKWFHEKSIDQVMQYMFQLAIKAPQQDGKDVYEWTRFKILGPFTDPLGPGNLRQEVINSIHVITSEKEDEFLKIDYNTVIDPFQIKALTPLKFNNEVRGIELTLIRPLIPDVDKSSIKIANGDHLNVAYSSKIYSNNEKNILELGAFGMRQDQDWPIRFGVSDGAASLAAFASALALATAALVF